METWRLPRPYEIFGLVYLAAEYVTWQEVFPSGTRMWHLAAFVRFVSVGLGLHAARLHLSPQIRSKLQAVDQAAVRALDTHKDS